MRASPPETDGTMPLTTENLDKALIFRVESLSSLIAAVQTVERQEAGNGRVANSRQRGLLAQLVEQRTLNPLVECSSHSGPTNIFRVCVTPGSKATSGHLKVAFSLGSQRWLVGCARHRHANASNVVWVPVCKRRHMAHPDQGVARDFGTLTRSDPAHALCSWEFRSRMALDAR